MTLPTFDLTAHAATAIARRGIDPQWVERTLFHPETIEQHASDPALRHAPARITERGDRMLRVIDNASVDPPRVITAYFDRGQRGKP